MRDRSRATDVSNTALAQRDRSYAILRELTHMSYFINPATKNISFSTTVPSKFMEPENFGDLPDTGKASMLEQIRPLPLLMALPGWQIVPFSAS